MIVKNKNEKTRRHSHAALVIVGVCAALSLATARAETRFAPRFSVDATWTDNIELAPPGAPARSDVITQARPGFQFMHDTERVQTFADYQLQAVYFADDSETEIYHQGQLSFLAELLDEWFYVDLGGSRAQASVDPAQRVNVGNLFQVGNVADVTSAYVTPLLSHQFRLVQVDASYTRGIVDYSEANDLTTITAAQDDSENENITASLSAPDPEATLTWRAAYQRDEVDYDVSLPYRYDRATLELGLRVATSLRLIGRGGLESDPRIRSDEGGLDESSWMGGFAWRPSERNSLRAMVGERFYGTTYEFEWEYTGRVLEASVNYDESATTQSQSLILGGVNRPGEFPTQLDPGFSRLNSEVYISKQLTGRIGVIGRVTEIFLGLNVEDREYVSFAGFEDQYKGANLQVTRRLGPRLDLQGTVGYTRSDLREGLDFTEYAFNVRLTRYLGTRTQLFASANRFDRSSHAGYDANWVVVGFSMNFGAPEKTGARRGRAPDTEPTRRTLPTGPRYP